MTFLVLKKISMISIVLVLIFVAIRIRGFKVRTPVFHSGVSERDSQSEDSAILLQGSNYFPQFLQETSGRIRLNVPTPLPSRFIFCDSSFSITMTFCAAKSMQLKVQRNHRNQT
jgi:hypothetical protein